MEWSNKKSLIISLSEIVIYSGENRPLDFSYINPISLHLELEYNDRTNVQGFDNGNAVWQLSVDSKIRRQYRFLFNFLVDEFKIDKVDYDKGKTNGLAWSSKLIYSPNYYNKLLSIYCSFIYVGTHTFRHGLGDNNFVSRGRPLGWKYGSDGKEITSGVNYTNFKNFIFYFKFGKRAIGQNSLIYNLYDPYKNYLSGSFPSGNVNEHNFINLSSQYWIKNYMSVYISFNYTNSNHALSENSINFGIDFFRKIFN